MRTARPCRRASAPGSPWHASCSRTVRGCSSTSPPPTSTRSPSRSSPTRSRSWASTAAVVMVAHRPAMVALADRVLSLVPRAAPAHGAPTARRPSPEHRHPSTGRPTTKRRPSRTVRRRALGLSTVLGALASASGVALTATAGWLIVQASTQPRGADPAGRHRRGAHLRHRAAGAALRRAAAVRTTPPCGCSPAAASRSTTPSCPSSRRARPAPGDVLASSSTTSTAWSTASCGCGCRCASTRSSRRSPQPSTAVVLLPPAGLVVALTCLVAGPGGWLGWRAGRGPRRARRSSTRALLCLRRVVETLQVAAELLHVAGGASTRPTAWPQPASASAARTSPPPTWSGAARAAGPRATGVGVAATAAVASAALSPGSALGTDARPARADAARPGRGGGAARRRRGALGAHPGRGAETGPPGAYATRGPGHGRHRSTPRSSAIELCRRPRTLGPWTRPSPRPLSLDLGRRAGRAGRAVRVRQEHARRAAAALPRPGQRPGRRSAGRGSHVVAGRRTPYASVSSTTTRTSSPPRWSRTSGSRVRMRPTPRSTTRCAGPASGPGSTPCPTASTPGSATGTRRVRG